MYLFKTTWLGISALKLCLIIDWELQIIVRVMTLVKHKAASRQGIGALIKGVI